MPESVFSGQLTLRFLPGDLTGVALGHDLHILVVELIAQIEEGGDDHADHRNQGVYDPQAVQGLLTLLGLFGGLDEAGNVAQDESGRTAFFYAAIVMGCVCVLGSFAHYFTTRERVKQTAADESKISFLAAAKMLLSCRSWLLNMLYVICYGMLNLLIMSTINYYATYVLGSAAAATPILAVFLVVSIIATLAATPIDRKLGRRKTMIVSALIYAAGKIWFVLDPYSMGAIYCKAPFDPESAASVSSNYYQGVDYFMTPSTRSFGFNVKLSF